MKYLKNYGLSDEEIDGLYENITEAEWDALAGVRTGVEEVIEYLKGKGVNNIKESLIDATYIFTYSLAEIKNLFDECQVEDIVKRINEDVSNYDLLF